MKCDSLRWRSLSSAPKTGTQKPKINQSPQVTHQMHRHAPNWAVKRTPTQAMPSAFSWPVLVPSAPSVLRRRLPWALGSNYVLLGKPGSPCNRCSACCRKWRPRGTERRLDSKQGRDSSFPLHAVRPPSLDLGRNFQPLWCNQRFNSWRLPGAASFTFLGLALGLSIDRAPCGKWMVSLSARDGLNNAIPAVAAKANTQVSV